MEGDSSGSLYQKDGVYVGILTPATTKLEDAKLEGTSKVDDYIKLKNAGFTADEILQLTK